MQQISIELLDDIIEGDRLYKCGDLSMVCLQRNSKRVKNYVSSSPYILFGSKQTIRRQIYIGQTNNIDRRIKEHRFHKDFWEEIIFFVYNREFTKTETEWFERELIIEFLNSNNFDMMQNAQIPKRVIINEKDDTEMHEILQTIKLLLNVFGCIITAQNALDDKLPSNALIDRIARAYKYLPEQNNIEEDEIKPNFFKNIAYYNIGNIFYIKKDDINTEKDLYFHSENELKQYIETL